MAAASIPYAFVIVGKRDNPIYETEWLRGPKREERSHLNQFIIHAALDEVDELKWKNKNMYLGKVDSFNDIHVSSFVTACNFRLMMLHDGKNEDGVRNFFRDAYELAVKMFMNPFYDALTVFEKNSAFDLKIAALFQKHL